MVEKNSVKYLFFDLDDELDLLNLMQDDEFVGGEEMNFKLRSKKQSRRWKCKNNKERRFSRLNLGDNSWVWKFSGLQLQWGLKNQEF